MTNGRLVAMALLAAAALGAAHPERAPAQEPGRSEYDGAAALGLSLRRAGTVKRVLMIGAHPDDEDTQALTYWSLREGADVAYLSLTRGEGGQNGIGTELHEALGLLRTEELLSARRVEGAAQLFSRAFDFGYSKSAEETFRHWPREEVLSDVVAAIRRFRPDVVVAVFSGTPRDGHGQHQVSGMLAREAFAAAGDGTRFPEQLRAGLRPHRAAKLYVAQRSNPQGATASLPVGELDPLVGRSYFQLSMASRSRHRSQDMGRPETAGPRSAYLRRILPASDRPEASIWEGIDTTLAGRADTGTRGNPPGYQALAAYDREIAAARAAANALDPDRVVEPLARALRALDSAAAEWARADPSRVAPEAPFHALAERADAQAALARAARLVLDATAARPRLVPGDTVTVTVSLWNGGTRAVRVGALEPRLPAGWSAEALDPMPAELAAGALATRRFRVRVPAGAAPSEAYFLRAPRQGDLYRWTGDVELDGRPFEPAAVRASASVTVAGAGVDLSADATFAELDLRQGELRRPVLVVPAVSVRALPAATVLPLRQGRAVAPLRWRVRLSAARPVAGTLRVAVPAGWRADPSSLPLRFAAAGESREVDVTVVPTDVTAEGTFEVSAAFEAEDGRTYDRGLEVVDYPHVRARPLYHAARTRVVAADLRVPAVRVAYVTGAGEEGPSVLAPLGITPDLLDEKALASGDLSRYDVIVAGSRAYEVRPDLAAHNDRLLEYVRNGGTMIVLYNKYELVEGRFTPYPLTMARPHGRVADETAPVRVLVPDHPVFTAPNRIAARDWEGWVQERGLYFAQTWDPAYTPLLETGDPGSAPLRGGLLVAKHGRGTYVYTGLAFFRQLPEGHPGAYRLFANLLALGAKPGPVRE